ncbi:MAG: hypothetical protein K6U89_17245 [Chloroflexi bacterium]|nr:hypothetical protein [Chloroflexota bacterium]
MSTRPQATTGPTPPVTRDATPRTAADATTLLAAAARLSDDDLLTRVTVLAAREREATVALVAHLAELDARGLHLAAGYASLFSYCTGALHLSEHAAYHRIQAARAVRRFPVILELLASGALTLTTVTLLAPHLTSANHRELLQAASGRSKREVEVLVASLHPQPPVPVMIRRLPQRPPMTAAAGTSGPQSGAALTGAPEANQARLEPGRAPIEPGTAPKAAGPAEPPEASAGTTRPSRRPVLQPLAPGRYKIQFTASAATVAKLRQAQDLLRHQIPDGDLGEVIDRALTALLRQLAQRKAGAAPRPRESADRSRANGEPDGVRRQGDGRRAAVPRPQCMRRGRPSSARAELLPQRARLNPDGHLKRARLRSAG